MPSHEKKYVVGIGAANVDVYAKSNIDIKEHYDHPSIIKTSAGGVTRNILENASKLGLKTVLLTAASDDVYGKLVIDSCKKAKIDYRNILTIKNERTGIFLQVQDKNNDMHIALCDMSISKYIDINYIKSKEKIIKNASAIVLDPSLNNEIIKYIIKKFNNVPIFVDPISDLYAKKIKPFLKDIYCIKPNRSELQVLSKMEINNDFDAIKAYKKINKIVKKLYVSMAEKGCIYKDDNNHVQMRKFRPISKMVNASGAGDAMMAGLLYGYINSLDEEMTIDYALAAGTCTILDEHAINPNLSIKLLRKTIKENKI